MNLPKRFEDLTLKQYIDLIELDKDLNLTVIEKAVKKLSILSGKAIEDIESLDFKKLFYYLAKVKFTNEPPENIAFKKSFIIGFRKYVATTNLQEMKPAQLIDFAALQKANKPLNDLLAVMYKRSGKEYDYKEHEKISKELLKAKVSDCLGLVFFYLNFFKKCEPLIVQFLEKQQSIIKEGMKGIVTDKEFTSSLKTGDGNIM
jgi:hypothetical protein